MQACVYNGARAQARSQARSRDRPGYKVASGMAPVGDSPSGRQSAEGFPLNAGVTPPHPPTASAQHFNGGLRRNDKRGSESNTSPKAQAIREACKLHRVDDLKELALSKGGFLSDSLRRQAWPVLLGLTPEDEASNPDGSPETNTKDLSWKELPRHRDEDQVQLDVDRAFVYYPNRMHIFLQTLAPTCLTCSLAD